MTTMGKMALLAILLLMLSSAMGTLSAQAADIPGSQQTSSWTIALYMSGDNNLDEFVARDIGEFLDAGVPAGVNVILLTDGSGTGDSILARISGGTLVNITDPPFDDELIMTDPAVLAMFLNYSFDHFPADEFYLGLWGHGDGWRGMLDDRSSTMSLTALSTALEWGIGRERRISVLGMDMCSMMTLEVASEVAPYADYLLASEMEIPDFGLPYGTMMDTLDADPGISPAALATALAEDYIDTWSRYSQYSLTMSVADLEALDLWLREDFSNLWGEMGDLTPGINSETIRARDNSESYQSGGYVDFGDLLRQFLLYRDMFTVHPALRETLDAYENAMIYSGRYDHPRPNDGVHVDNSTGAVLSFIWGQTSRSYDALRLSVTTQWDEFLNVLVSAPPEAELEMKPHYLLGNLDVEYTMSLSRANLTLEVFDGNGRSVAVENMSNATSTGDISTPLIYPGWTIPVLSVVDQGRVVAIEAGAPVWTWGSKEDVSLRMISLRRGDGRLIQDEMRPVEGEETGVLFLTTSSAASGDMFNVTVMQGGTELVTEMMNVGPNTTLHEISVRLRSGEGPIAVRIDPGRFPDYDPSNNADSMELSVLPLKPTDPYHLEVILPADVVGEGHVVVENLRTGERIHDGYTSDQSLTVESSPRQYNEGDTLRVTMSCSGTERTREVRAYSTDSGAEMFFDFTRERTADITLLLLSGTLGASLLWMIFLLRVRNDRPGDR